MFRFHQGPPRAAVLDGGIGAGYAPARAWAQITRPAWLFVVFSVLFGTLAAIIVPPLRGADEPAHFLRAYGLSRGEILSFNVDEKGRKGIVLPAALADDFTFFQDARYKVGTPGFAYGDALTAYMRQRSVASAAEASRPPVFVLYEGSEGYTPAAYLPYIAAAGLARLAGLDFLGTLYLMRLVGLAATTVLIAYAITLAPRLGWAFLFIGMLPSALSGRAVISADGCTLGFTMLVLALSLAGASRAFTGDTTGKGSGLWERMAWMTLCILSKPPQIAFTLLETLRAPLRELPQRWRTLGLVLLPGLILSPLWVVAVGGDAGTWRISDGSNLPAEQFDPLWKLGQMALHPLLFPQMLLATLTRDCVALWPQLIGVLGWGDTWLQPLAYPLLGAGLVASFLARLELDRAARLRIAGIGLLTMLVYVVSVYLVFFLAWSPIGEGFIYGVQGRYFVVLLPVAAAVVAALVDRAPPRAVMIWIATAGSILSAAATIEAVGRLDWGW
jgi:uncharacterized membrane protein